MNKQARTKTRELRKAQEEAARRQRARRRIVTVLGGLVVLGLVAAIAVVIVRAVTGDETPVGSGEVVQPQNTTPDGAIPVGEEDAPVSVDLYYDYMCPACGAFEQVNGEELDRMIEAGDITLQLRPISFLDEQSSGTNYSTRTGNAIATVADGAPGAVWDFHRALYEAQPEEGSEGLSDQEIADIALDTGVPQGVVDDFENRTFEGWVASVTEQAFDGGVEGTPTVKIDGETYDGDVYTPGTLTEAIEAAGAEG